MSGLKGAWEQIFESQAQLNNRIIENFDEQMADEKVRIEWLLKFSLALQQEQSEAIDSVSWKWWTEKSNDWENVQIELIDMLHFLVSMCQIAGLDAQKAYDLYLNKNKLNHDRQEKGYKEGTYDKYEGGIEDNKKLFD